jgi:Zn-dependent oligopeptidase
MNINNISFKQFEQNFKSHPRTELEKSFDTSRAFFTEQTADNNNEKIENGIIFVELFTFQEIADLRKNLEVIRNQSVRREGNETLVLEKMQEFVNAIGLKMEAWRKFKILLCEMKADAQKALDQKTPVVQV